MPSDDRFELVHLNSVEKRKKMRICTSESKKTPEHFVLFW